MSNLNLYCMEKFRLKSRLLYGGSIFLIWFLCGLILLGIFNLISETISSFWLYYLFFLIPGIVVSWIHSCKYYCFMNEVLQVKSDYHLFGSIILKEIVRADIYNATKFNHQGLYSLRLTNAKGKKFYLYPENQDKLVSVLKGKCPSLSLEHN